MTSPSTPLIVRWAAARAAVAESDRLDHPPIVDTHGREWVWRSGDLYVHDDTLAVAADMIPGAGLPPVGLADRNPNYAGLCPICRHEAAP